MVVGGVQQGPRVEKKIKVMEDKGPNSLVDLHRKPVIIRIKCQVLESASTYQ